MTDLTTSDLAARLGVTRRHATDLLISGAVDGRQLSSGMWLASNDAVVRYEARTRRGKGRRMDASTAWGLLWELGGDDAFWLTPSTRSRIRSKIRTMSAEQIARAVAGRTTAYYFNAANAATASAGLIATGSAVASHLNVGLMDDVRRVSGYTRQGSVDAHARANFMLEATSGRDVLYDNTLPIGYERDAMPAAVIAADLATSIDSRERSGGLRALEDLRATWLASQ